MMLATPDYKLDEAYFQHRFNAYPWFLTYLKQQEDGDFWRRNSLRWQYDKIQVPCYLIGGFLDGYRDSIPRMLESMNVPIKAEIGPWNHAWPDTGEPGPNYEWRHEAVRWWGEPTGDMRPDDAGSLVFDGPRLEQGFEMVGFPKVRLRISADASLAHWIARLEDVNPNGTVSLVTGALLNGSQRQSRLKPEPLVPGRVYDLEFDLHFTTWTFKPGHRVRLAISNSLFPMIWPTPGPMITTLFMGDENTSLELPVVPQIKRKEPAFRPPEPREERPDARSLGGDSWPQGRYEKKQDPWKGITSVEWIGSSDYEIRGRKYSVSERNYYETNEERPAGSAFHGKASHRLELNGRTVGLFTTLDVLSDEKYFHVVFKREIFENDKLVRQREWQETIPRNFQ